MNKRKRKIRVPLRKNRGKRTRPQNLTHEALESEVSLDSPQQQRLSGKGDLTRYRTVIAQTDDEDRVVIDVDESVCVRGRVLQSIGSTQCDIQLDDGRTLQCSVRRVVRTLAREARNAVVAGDFVLVQPTSQTEGVIERVEERTSVIARTSGRHQHVIVSNVDQVVIVASASDPPLKPNLIDRFLVSAEKGGVRAVICINKADLADPAELIPIAGLYGRLGYDVVLTSATRGLGIGRLKELLSGRESVFAGQSGVGKSSLLNEVLPELRQQTSDVSAESGKGRHTTRTATLIPLPSGGWVVDTPGIRQMELWDVAPGEVEGYFREFRPHVAACRFPDCTHLHEHDCGVRNAVEAGVISQQRYASYERMMLSQ